MRTLKYAILGLLNQKSMSGYELMQQFESTLNEFWSAKHSQIYPELKKLTDEGMIDFKVEITGTVLEKKVYTMTEAGQKDFMRWLEKDESMATTPKDVFRLRMFFSNRLEPEKRIFLFQMQMEQHKIRKEYLEKNQKKFDGIPALDTDEFSDYLVLMGAVMREDTTIKWLEQCIILCKNGENKKK